LDYITEYNDKIQSGVIVTSKRVKQLYKQLADRIANPSGRYVFDEKRAQRPIDFIQRFCRHSKGEWAGRPIELQLFQKAFISALFGFIDPATGLRQYREAFFMVGRKNGKSVMLSGIALYMLIGDHEPGAECYSIATRKDQARIIFEEMQNMVNQSPELRALIKKRKSDLYCPATMSKMQPLGKNSDSLDGLNAHCVVIDELHAVKDRNLYEVMKQSQSARRQPLLIMITTAGTVRECIFDDQYQYAINVLDGTMDDPTFLPVIYELDKRNEWKNPKYWIKANPGLGVIKKVDDLQTKAARAKTNAKDLKMLLVKDFNIRETATQAWLNFDDINNTDTFSLEQFRGWFCVGGVDLSLTTDLTAAAVLFIDPATEQRFVYSMAWLPADRLDDHVKNDRIPYDIWHKQGLLRLCAGNTINYSDVTTWFLELVNDHGVTPLWIYYDSWSARYWVDEMTATGFNMVRCIQGAKTLSLPMQQMGADLQKHKINYNNNPILKWCLTNTGVQVDRNQNIVPVKSKNAKQRIDATMAMLDCYVGLMDHYEELKNA